MLCWIATSGECRTKPSLVSRKAAFGLGSLAILPTWEAIMHHPPISALGWSRCVAGIDRDRGTANAKLLTTQSVIVFRIVPSVGQHTPWLKIIGCLTHCGREVGRVLARALSGNSTNNQLTRGMKDRCQLRPRGVSDARASTATLKVNRSMTSFQPCRIDCCRMVGMLGNQATSSPSVTAACQKSFKAFFSRSFCSTCQSVE